MTLTIYGYNYKTTPIEVRERLCSVFSDSKQALITLSNLQIVQQVLILSTCNRIELYCVTDQPDRLAAWLAEQHQQSQPNLANQCYRYDGEQAIRHLLRVACGLDSMVKGEPQILGQLKNAYAQSRRLGVSSKTLNTLMETVFNCAKTIRTETGLNQYPISVAYAAIMTLRQHVVDLSQHNVLLVGAGSTTALLLQYLTKYGCHNLWLANRQYDTARELVERYNTAFVPLEHIDGVFDRIDTVVSATASHDYVIGEDHCQQRGVNWPSIWIDLAVPRDIDPAVPGSEARLYNVDDMQNFLADNWQKRQQASLQAEKLIDDKVQSCLEKLRLAQAEHVIKNYRQNMDHIKQAELAEAYKDLAQGAAPEQVLNTFAHRVTQKLLHQPTVTLRQAAASRDQQMFNQAKRMLNVND
jgi:glutamyl-tRNA reductase